MHILIFESLQPEGYCILWVPPLKEAEATFHRSSKHQIPASSGFIQIVDQHKINQMYLSWPLSWEPVTQRSRERGEAILAAAGSGWFPGTAVTQNQWQMVQAFTSSSAAAAPTVQGMACDSGSTPAGISLAHLCPKGFLSFCTCTCELPVAL